MVSDQYLIFVQEINLKAEADMNVYAIFHSEWVVQPVTNLIASGTWVNHKLKKVVWNLSVTWPSVHFQVFR